MLDLEPATRMLGDLVIGVRDDQLTAPTPCHGTSVAGLLEHVDGLCSAFVGAAAKQPAEGRPVPSADEVRLADGWRTRIPEKLAALAEAWRDESAWTGMTRAGGLDLPGKVVGVVALDEVVVHGWDIAVSSGQSFDCPEDLLAACHRFLLGTVERFPEGSPGLFGPPVAVPDGAPLLDRVIGLAGRDPGWRAAGA